jgi:hypothetical protein
MKRGLIVLVLITAVAAAGIALAQALIVEEPVLNTIRNERNPSADFDGVGGGVLAFTRSRKGFPNRYDAWARKGTTTAVKLNQTGQGWTGGMDYPIVAYQQIGGGNSNVWFYDLDTSLRTAAPINTGKWEWRPMISGTLNEYHLLFGQDDISTPTQRVVLHHHNNVGPIHNSLTLSTVTRASHYLQPDQLNGDWATFTRCTPVCNVIRYKVSTGERIRLAKPVNTNRPRFQYAGAVTPGGVVFLVRSGPRCGERVRIIRYDPSNPSDPLYGSLVIALPSGRDIATAYVRDNGNGSATLVYDRVVCSTGRFDVFKLELPTI